MLDPDIEDEQEAIEAVDLYEWSITDSDQALYSKWKEVVNITFVNSTHVC